MNKRGFTLIELLIVITIIGILSAVAVTAYVGAVKKAARSEAYTTLDSLRLLEEQFFAENAAYAPNAVCLHTTVRADGTCFVPATVLPGFRPGSGRSYDFAVVLGVRLNNTGGVSVANPPGIVAAPVNAPCFVAIAAGVAGTRVCADAANCDMFAVDCNNNRNF